MNQREREICSRLKELRERLGRSQKIFSAVLQVSHNRLASLEYGRTPLRADTAIQLTTITGCNLHWLAEGTGPVFAALPNPDFLAQIPPRWLFSRAWKAVLKRTLKPGAKRFGEAELAPGVIGGASAESYCKEEIEGVLKFLPSEFHWNFFAHISRSARDFVAMNQVKITELNAHRAIPAKLSPKKDLTYLATSGIPPAVKNQWPMLKRQVQETTADAGAKSRLAKFLGVDLTRVSRWLADSKTAPEPGAEFALRMQFWVEHPEVRQSR
jgi:transcriptional regulator with XRE-family HTH domain